MILVYRTHVNMALQSQRMSFYLNLIERKKLVFLIKTQNRDRKQLTSCGPCRRRRIGIGHASISRVDRYELVAWVGWVVSRRDCRLLGCADDSGDGSHSCKKDTSIPTPEWEDFTLGSTRVVRVIEGHLTLGSGLVPCYALVEQTTRSRAADAQTHAAEDRDNTTEHDCYDHRSFTEFVKDWPVWREAEHLYEHVLNINHLQLRGGRP